MIHQEILNHVISSSPESAHSRIKDRFERLLSDAFKDRSRSYFRMMLDTGYGLSDPNASKQIEDDKVLDLLSDLLSCLYRSSVVIDDIQTGNPVRNGQSTLHVRYGMPLALNAASWIASWPFDQLTAMGLPAIQEHQLQKDFHHTLSRSRIALALDQTIRVSELSQGDVTRVCWSSIENKTGRFYSLAIKAGGIIGGASPERLSILSDWGKQFGNAIRMLDDGETLLATVSPEKQLRDFHQDRPSWVWLLAAQELPSETYASMLNGILALPEEKAIREWIHEYCFDEIVPEKTAEYLDKSIQKFAERLEESAIRTGGFEPALKQVREFSDSIQCDTRLVT